MKILTNLDFNKNQALKLVIQNLATEPTDPKQGMVYYNTTDNRMYYYDGKKWIASDSKDIKLDPSSIKGLDKILEKKVDAEDGKGLISKKEKEKLDRLKELVIEDTNIESDPEGEIPVKIGLIENHNENGVVSTSHFQDVVTQVEQVINGNFSFYLESIMKGFDTVVKKEEGKGLSTNDYTDVARAKVESIPSGYTYLKKSDINQDIEKAKTESKNYAKGLIDTLVGSGTPETLDTLKEIANALDNDPNFTTTLLNKIGEKTKKVVKTIGDNSKNVIKVTHNLNTRDVGITVRTTASPYEIVYTDVEFTDNNNITLKFANAPKKDEYTVVVIG